MSRGVGRGEIFLTNDDYSRFLEYMASAREKFNLDIFAFVLMANHYHILLRTNDANLSRVMQWIQTVIAFITIVIIIAVDIFSGKIYKSVLSKTRILLSHFKFIYTFEPYEPAWLKRWKSITSSYHRLC
ncbi:MAG: transposase [Candidatus Scalindua sp.]|nr:transposase [Candidatus Scalindua sp.]